MLEVGTGYSGLANKELVEREESLDREAIEIFSKYRVHEQIVLLCPLVLVRVLPKDMYVGRIYIPDVKGTNKPIYEGVVLRTWGKHLISGKRGEIRSIRTDLEFGDHVLFPHFAGQPLPGLDEDRYRIIPEGITRSGAITFGNDVGVIFAKIDYKRPRVEDVFKSVMNEYFYNEDNRNLWTEILKRMREEFDISVKVKQSLTKSGV